MLYRRKLIHPATIAVLIAWPLVSCQRSPAEPAHGDAITVTGTTVSRTGEPLPEDARLLVVWVVSSTSPDELHLFGEGTFEDAGETFRLELDGPPPTRALNGGSLGVGVIFATTNQEIESGDSFEQLPGEEEILGVAGWYAVVYVEEDLPAAMAEDWPGSFPMGYGVGVGVERDQGFDAFEPTEPDGVELIIDDLPDIDIVNWT